jgi:uncharacterized Tic20 family protein
MQSPQSISRIKNWATRIYARYGFGRIEEVSEYSAAGISKDVYWFDSDSKNSGHCTPFNTLLMNKRPFRDLSQTAQDYVFLHETGHSKLTFPFNLLMYALLIPTLILAGLSPFAAINQIIVTWYTTTSIYLTFLTLIAGITVVGIFTLLFMAASWLSEGHAELYALNRIGREPYLQTSKEIKEYADRSRICQTIHRIQYPPPRLIVWVSKKI